MGSILIIEDDHEGSQLLSQSLTFKGHHVLTVESVAAGLQIVKSQAIDLVVLDMFLPNEPGWVFLDSIKEIPELATLAVVILTAHERFRTLVDVEAYPNVEAVMMKPLGFRELRIFVDEFFASDSE